MSDAFYSFLLLSSWNFNKTGKSCGRNSNWTGWCFDKLQRSMEYPKKLLDWACWMVDEGRKTGSLRSARCQRHFLHLYLYLWPKYLYWCSYMRVSYLLPCRPSYGLPTCTSGTSTCTCDLRICTYTSTRPFWYLLHHWCKPAANILSLVNDNKVCRRFETSPSMECSLKGKLTRLIYKFNVVKCAY